MLQRYDPATVNKHVPEAFYEAVLPWVRGNLEWKALTNYLAIEGTKPLDINNPLFGFLHDRLGGSTDGIGISSQINILHLSISPDFAPIIDLKREFDSYIEMRAKESHCCTWLTDCIAQLLPCRAYQNDGAKLKRE